jgi:hypothetical protein
MSGSDRSWSWGLAGCVGSEKSWIRDFRISSRLKGIFILTDELYSLLIDLVSDHISFTLNVS